MRVSVSDLSGSALDWAVAQCEGVDLQSFLYAENQRVMDGGTHYYNYSTNWISAGPIIEQREIGVRRNLPCSHGREWEAMPSISAKGAGGQWAYGPTLLVAAMRCYVASTIGEIVEIPEELEE